MQFMQGMIGHHSQAIFMSKLAVTRGGNPRVLEDVVLGVVRSGELYRIDSPEAEMCEPGDRLLYVRRIAD